MNELSISKSGSTDDVYLLRFCVNFADIEDDAEIYTDDETFGNLNFVINKFLNGRSDDSTVGVGSSDLSVAGGAIRLQFSRENLLINHLHIAILSENSKLAGQTWKNYEATVGPAQLRAFSEQVRALHIVRSGEAKLGFASISRA